MIHKEERAREDVLLGSRFEQMKEVGEMGEVGEVGEVKEVREREGSERVRWGKEAYDRATLAMEVIFLNDVLWKENSP
jgi:hypothetical protein